MRRINRILMIFSSKMNARSGFTYIEVLVTIVILITAFGGILQVLGTSVRASERADHLKTATELARSELDRVIATGDTGTDAEISEYPGFTHQAEISGPDPDGLYRAEVTVIWQESGVERQESLSAYYLNTDQIVSGYTSKEHADAGLSE